MPLTATGKNTILVFAGLPFSALLLIVQVAGADQCDKLEREGRLIHQQFKKTKICRESKIGKGWTDCEFTAYGTSILLVGAIGTNVQDRLRGHFGTGFYVRSVDSMATIRFVFDSDFGSLVLVDAKDRLEKSGCLYNEAIITLDAQAYGPGEVKLIKMGPMAGRKTPEEKTKALQKDLKLLGYYKGDIDGQLGADTLGAIEKFKIAKEIPGERRLEDIEGLIALEALSKNVDELERLYNEGASPKPPLRR